MTRLSHYGPNERLTGCGKLPEFDGFFGVSGGPPGIRSLILRHSPAPAARILPLGPFWTDSEPGYAAVPGSFGIRAKL